MKPFSYIVRRTHLYLALFCLPWFVMYGVSSVAFSHPDWFPEGKPLYDMESGAWTEEGSWPCNVEPPARGDLPRDVALDLLQRAGLEAEAFAVYWAGDQQIDVHVPGFWKVRKLTFYIDEQRLALYSYRPIARHFLTGMHARAGYQHDSFLNDAWALTVDLAAVGFLLWVVTGFVIWWSIRDMRIWGAVALCTGLLAFAAFMLTL